MACGLGRRLPSIERSIQKCECVLFFLVLMLSGFGAEGLTKPLPGVWNLPTVENDCLQWCWGRDHGLRPLCALAGQPGEWEKKARKPFGAAMREAF